ncbi:MAG: thiamine pyrophosphate-binding protein [Pseudomonadota bacterium]
MSETLTAADMLAQTLAANGVKRAYGIPGGEVLAIIDAFDRAGIEFLLIKHENSGGFMAEGGWHADGHPAVLVATVGPGVANAVNVVANAMQDRVPLIFVTGCVDTAEAESYTHQVFDHRKMLEEITKATFTGTTSTCGLIAQKAVSIAMEPQAGPVHLDIPVSVAEAQSTETLSVGPSPAPVLQPTQDATFDEACALLEKAKNPVAILGVDAVNELAGPTITGFCQKHNIPVIASYKAKGLINENDQLNIGGAGLSPKADKILLPLLEKSDCIFLVGYDPIEMRIGWRNPWGTDKTVIEITPILRTHGMHHVSHTIRASVVPTLNAMSEKMEQTRTQIAKEAAKARQEFWNTFAAESEFGPDRVFSVLREALPDDTVATADSGAHRILLSQMWPCHHPRGLLQSSALCTMACAVPLAAGYKQASPDTPVIAFVGDAGLEMGLGELATLREHNIPIIICVLVDESLTLIEMKQRASQRPNLGVDFTGSDFPSVANALGGVGVWVDDSESLKREAEEALERDCFTVLACRIGRKSYDGKF